MSASPAIAYVRVSGAGQAADDRDGLPRQRRAVAAFCRQKRLTLVEEHVDAGVSGATPLAAREGLSRALERCRELGAVLVVERPDRLSRDLIAGELALAAFRDAGVQVLDTAGTDLTSSSNATTVLVRQLLGAVAQHDKAAIVARLAAARARVAAAGGHAVGAYRYGEHPEKPEELEVVERIKQLRQSPGRGRKVPSWEAVAAALNGEGRRTRTGRPWTKWTAADVLADR